MDVILSISSDVGSSDTIGARAGYIAKECVKRSYLRRVICRKNSLELPKKTVYQFPFFRRIALVCTGFRIYVSSRFPATKILGELYDWLAARYVVPCDVFHTWDLSYNSLKKAKELGAKTIVDIHMAPVGYVKGKVTLPDTDYFGPFLPFIDYFCVPSPFIVDVLQKIGIPKKAIIYVPFGVDTTVFKPAKKKSKKFIVMFAGTLNHRKGLPALLQAWNELNLPNAELRLCGRVYKEFHSILAPYKRNSSIVMLGHLSHKELLDEYHEASVFVLPSIVEGSAKATYEAMACGLPIIATPNAGSVARDGKEGYLVPIDSVKSLKEKISYLYDNPKVRERMGKSARKRVEHYTWDVYATKVVDTYEKCCKEESK